MRWEVYQNCVKKERALFLKESKEQNFTILTFRFKTFLATTAIYLGVLVSSVIINCPPLALAGILLYLYQFFLCHHNAHIDDRLIEALHKQDMWLEGKYTGIYHDLPQPEAKNWYNALTFRKKTYIATSTIYIGIALAGMIMSCMPLAVCGALLLVYNLFLGFNNVHIDDRLLDAYKKEGKTWGICHELPPGAKAFKKFFDSKRVISTDREINKFLDKKIEKLLTNST